MPLASKQPPECYMKMPYYCVRSISPTAPEEAFWVRAKSADIARQLVALNVSWARAARDGRLFRCYQDETKKPPAGMIHSDHRGPIPIALLG